MFCGCLLIVFAALERKGDRTLFIMGTIPLIAREDLLLPLVSWVRPSIFIETMIMSF